MSDQYLTKVDDVQCQTLNLSVAHSKEPSDATEVTILFYDIDSIEPFLSMATKSGSQLTKNKHNVFLATTSYHLTFGPHFIEIRQLSPTSGLPESPTTSNRGQRNIVRPNDLPDTPAVINPHFLLNISSLVHTYYTPNHNLTTR